MFWLGLITGLGAYFIFMVIAYFVIKHKTKNLKKGDK